MDVTEQTGRNILDYWAMLRRRRWVIGLVVAIAGLVALVGSFLATPLYRSTVTILIERRNPNILAIRDMSVTDNTWAAYVDFYQTQYKILASDAIARRAVQRAGLVNHPLFDGEATEPGLYARLRGLFPERSGPAVQRSPEDLAVAMLQGRLEISPVRNSQLVGISWVSPDPELAAKVANAVADAFTAFNIETDSSASDEASEFLVDQIATLKNEIAEIEAGLQDYGEAKRIVSIDDANNITLKALSDVSQRRTEAKALLAQKEAAYDAVRSAPPEALPEVLGSDLIARLKQEYASYEAEYSEKSRLFKDGWPGIKTLRSKMDQAKERLDLETGEIARTAVLAAEAEYDQALKEVENLDDLLAQQETAAQTLRRDAVEFVNLHSEVQKKRETLDALIGRQNEMALSTRLKDLDATSSKTRVVDRARPATGPFRPRKRFNVLVGMMLGLSLGIGLAFLLEYLDNTIASAADVSRVVSLPTLAVVPHHGNAPPARLAWGKPHEGKQQTAPSADLVAHEDRHAAASETFRELRTAILLSSAGHPPNRIMVTSALPEEGKSSTAVNLAIVLAQLGRRVVLVDTDLRRPRLHEIFAAANDRGLSTYLSGLEADPRSLVASTSVPGLDLVPSGPIPPDPSELLNSRVFAGLGPRFRDTGYDHVLYDSPPTLSVPDPVIIASEVDAAILVVRAGRTPRESLRLAAEKFARADIRPIGVVVNDLDLKHHGYTHYRYYGRHPRDRAVKDRRTDRARSAGGS